MANPLGLVVVAREAVITVAPATETGLFSEVSFRDLIGHRFEVAGLDPGHHHTLRSVEIVAGPRMVLDHELGRYVERVVFGGAAILTLITEAERFQDHTAYVQVVSGFPLARAQIRHADTDTVLHERGRFPAPFSEGQVVGVDSVDYHVVRTTWPARDAVSGSSNGAEDYQVVYVREVPAEPPVRLADQITA